MVGYLCFTVQPCAVHQKKKRIIEVNKEQVSLKKQNKTKTGVEAAGQKQRANQELPFFTPDSHNEREDQNESEAKKSSSDIILYSDLKTYGLKDSKGSFTLNAGT